MSRKHVLFAVVMGLMLVMVCTAGAQTASIAGTVADLTGAVVQGAEITVLNTDTGAVRTVNSGDSGAYAVTNLSAGKYRVEIKKQNFAQFRVTDITLTVDQALTINATLKPGAASETVEVTAATLPPGGSGVFAGQQSGRAEADGEFAPDYAQPLSARIAFAGDHRLG